MTKTKEEDWANKRLMAIDRMRKFNIPEEQIEVIIKEL